MAAACEYRPTPRRVQPTPWWDMLPLARPTPLTATMVCSCGHADQSEQLTSAHIFACHYQQVYVCLIRGCDRFYFKGEEMRDHVHRSHRAAIVSLDPSQVAYLLDRTRRTVSLNLDYRGDPVYPFVTLAPPAPVPVDMDPFLDLGTRPRPEYPVSPVTMLRGGLLAQTLHDLILHLEDWPRGLAETVPTDAMPPKLYYTSSNPASPRGSATSPQRPEDGPSLVCPVSQKPVTPSLAKFPPSQTRPQPSRTSQNYEWPAVEGLTTQQLSRAAAGIVAGWERRPSSRRQREAIGFLRRALLPSKYRSWLRSLRDSWLGRAKEVVQAASPSPKLPTIAEVVEGKAAQEARQRFLSLLPRLSAPKETETSELSTPKETEKFQFPAPKEDLQPEFSAAKEVKKPVEESPVTPPSGPLSKFPAASTESGPEGQQGVHSLESTRPAVFFNCALPSVTPAAITGLKTDQLGRFVLPAGSCVSFLLATAPTREHPAPEPQPVAATLMAPAHFWARLDALPWLGDTTEAATALSSIVRQPAVVPAADPNTADELNKTLELMSQHADFAEVVTRRAPTNLHSLATQSKLPASSDMEASAVVATQSTGNSEVTIPEMIPASQNYGRPGGLIASETPMSPTVDLQLFSAPLAESEDFSIMDMDEML